MRRVLYFLTLIIACTAAHGQDFVSRFMQSTVPDSGMICQVISPKMMEKLIKFHHEQADTTIVYDELVMHELTKIKTVQIVTSVNNGHVHYNRAMTLLANNPQRFTSLSNEETKDGNTSVYMRKKGKAILELVTLQLRKKNDSFTVINLIGHMDDKFLQSLRTGADDKP